MRPLEHLLDPEFSDWDDADITTIVSAQANTADTFLQEIGSPEHLLGQDSADRARAAFAAVTNPQQSEEEKKRALAALRVPQAVKHLAGMLSQYDWDFVEQAKELRGYVVAKLMEETTHPDARIRLRSLELIGKVTEVASFTERSEVIHKQEETSVVEERLRARLKSMLPPVQEIQDTEVKEIAIVKHGG